jgi:glycosyltransferase involved in cell wall biosynthesis
MENKISICFISGAYPECHDGVGDYTAKLIGALNKENLEINLITSDEELIHKYVRQHDLSRVFPVIKRWNVFAVIAILKLVVKEKFDIIHLQFPSSRYKKTIFLCFLPFLLRFFFKKKVIATLHEFSVSYPINKVRQILLSLGSHRIVVTDDNDARQLARSIGSKKRKISLIPIGSNIDICEHNLAEKEAFLEKTGLSKQAKIIIFFGFIHPNKGIEYLLKSMRKIIDRGIAAQLLIVSRLDFSNNAYHKKLKKLIDFLGINKSIFITGYVTPQEVSKFLSFSDICALPFVDGVTMRRGTLMAALMHGKAIISTKSNNYVPHQLANRKNIYLVPINDAEGLAGAIEVLCTNNQLRQKIAEAASHLSQDFSWEKIAQAHKKLYENVIGN